MVFGNDYIYIDATKGKMDWLYNDMIHDKNLQAQPDDMNNKDDIERMKNDTMKRLAMRLSNRHFGIGGDGIILIEDSNIADFKMCIFNQDGSEAEMCGNGIRCVGKFVYDKKLTQKEEITIETLAGVKTLKLYCKDSVCDKVCVNMGEPYFKSDDLPTFLDEEITKDLKLKVKGEEFRFTLVSMGNPHAVTFVDNVEDIPLEIYGPMIENNNIFPRKTNVEFVEIIDKSCIKMRVWERGSGETLACGTGACAAVIAGGVNGYINHNATVELPGGELQIVWEKDNKVYMTGSATIVFDGKMEVAYDEN